LITQVTGIRVGHWTDPIGLTGCTVVLCPPGTLGSGEVRGGAPGTRETDLLRPGMTVNEVHAVLLTGGSAFGLAAADGVVRFLEEQGIGFDTGVARVPIVPAAVLFDLGVGDPQARPGPDAGYEACQNATDQVEEGNVGAGTGATVANLHGRHRAVKGGLGTASKQEGDVVVGAVAAVNAFGEVLDENGDLLAAARPDPEAAAEERTEEGPWPPSTGQPSTSESEGQATEGTAPGNEAGPTRWPPDSRSGGWAGTGPRSEVRQPTGLAQSPEANATPEMTNTTLVVVASNAKLSKERAHLLSLAGHDGIDSAIRPAHTMWDGDTVFSLATGEVEADQRTLEALTVEVVAEAIRRAVLLAQGVPGFPSGRGGLQP
jgi:L-aminopeptidase/D-esterase-like protein